MKNWRKRLLAIPFLFPALASAQNAVAKATRKAPREVAKALHCGRER